MSFQLQLSMEGKSAWKWNAKRKQFYYHVFSEQQPDFNLRNPSLVEQLKVSFVKIDCL